MKGNKSGKRMARAAAYLLMAALSVGTFTGCGGGSGNGAGGAADSGQEAGDAEQKDAMGRYVEKDVDLGGSSLTDWRSRLFRQEDGSYLLADNSGFVLRSTDNGASWLKADMPWLTKMKEENKYIRFMAIGLDGTAAVVWTEPEEGTEDSGNGVQLKMDMQLPYVCGRKSDTDKMTGLSEIADTMELMRENDPDTWLMGLPSAKGMMRVFSPACVPAWRTEDGALDAEAVSDFLTQTKRMYDAQMEGLPEGAVEDWEADRGFYQEFESPTGEAMEDTDAIRVREEAVQILGGRRQFVAGVVEDAWRYNIQLSVPWMEGFADCVSVPMEGQCSNVFWARTLLGINASSKNAQQAQDFVKTTLGNKVQVEILNGLPVTEKAIMDNYKDQWEVYKDNDYVSGMGGTVSLDGEDIYMMIRVPDEKTVNELIRWIESMDTAYIEDKTFENVVYEEGRLYLMGKNSLEEVMSSIETRLGIYLTE